jgi:hypothetical protein
MREYILTEKERKIVKMYLKEGYDLNGFNVLKIRIKRAIPLLKEDFELINSFMERLDADME